MIRPKVRLAALVAVPVLLWGCASPNVHFAEAQALYGNADYYQAYQAVLLAREQDPDNAEIERAYWVFRHGYLLSEAQRLVFSNQEHLALDLIEKILALDPDDPIALRWKGKAYDKLANRAVDEGDRMIGGGDLAGALVAFDRALKYDPGSIRAREGIDKLSETWTRQQDQARTHFVDGVRALGDYQYRRTSYHLGIAIEKDPTLTEAVEAMELASRQLAEDRFAAAKAMEDGGFYRPALREYRAIATARPGLEGVAERIERAQIESDVADLADAGELAIYRGDYVAAREMLDRAFAMTARQKDVVAERLLLARERELEFLYTAAKDLELQRQLETALVAYAEIEASMPGYQDVRARISDLEVRIEEARTAYAAGVAAEERGDIQAAIDGFTGVQLFWQGYLDSRERLAELRKRRMAANGTD